uniref:Uncharacterized protein n=1 Tax=Rhizophora mucronata TaxID=61149 RepID=A0A2P2NWS9_RHIMU
MVPLCPGTSPILMI